MRTLFLTSRSPDKLSPPAILKKFLAVTTCHNVLKKRPYDHHGIHSTCHVLREHNVPGYKSARHPVW